MCLIEGEIGSIMLLSGRVLLLRSRSQVKVGFGGNINAEVSVENELMSQNSNFSESDNLVDILNQDQHDDEYEHALHSGSAKFLLSFIMLWLLLGNSYNNKPK